MRVNTLAKRVGLALLGLVWVPCLHAQALVQFVMPTNGMTVRPGETIPVKVSVDPGLSHDTVLVSMSMEMVPLPAPSYEGTLTIGNEATGPLKISAVAFTASQSQGAGGRASITVIVIPEEAPQSIVVAESMWLTMPQSQPEVLQVAGMYADGVDRGLNFVESGVSYQSSNTGVATVDSVGALTAVGEGNAYITVQHGSFTEYTAVGVRQNPTTFQMTIDQTANVEITVSGFRTDPDTGGIVQTVSIRNTSPNPLLCPLVVVINGLNSGVSAMSETSVTTNIVPLGQPYAEVQNKTTKNLLKPNETATAVLSFRNPQGVPITYTPKVYTAESP